MRACIPEWAETTFVGMAVVMEVAELQCVVEEVVGIFV
jgi:hypothetical protein